MINSSVGIVVLNYRTGDLTIECLRSLSSEIERTPARILVIDNASGDGSVERIRAAISTRGWERWASVLPLERNGGYAFGNNAGIRLFLESADPPDLVMLLNPDTKVRPGAVQSLSQFMERHSTVGIVGSQLEDSAGIRQASGFRFHTIFSELDGGLRLGLFSKLIGDRVVVLPPSAVARRVDWVSGASMMIRRRVFESIGLLDEGYFLYFEEVDFARRAGQAGWECWVEPHSRVIHLQAQATEVDGPKSRQKRRPTYWFDSRRRYFIKHYGRAYAMAADAVWAAGYLTWRARRVLQRKPDPDPPKLLRDFILNSVFAKGFRI
jgi:N-acetylglucosaminyl-diphospho-decaprenol L-rhamnosyltransferase